MAALVVAASTIWRATIVGRGWFSQNDFLITLPTTSATETVVTAGFSPGSVVLAQGVADVAPLELAARRRGRHRPRRRQPGGPLARAVTHPSGPVASRLPVAHLLRGHSPDPVVDPVVDLRPAVLAGGPRRARGRARGAAHASSSGPPRGPGSPPRAPSPPWPPTSAGCSPRSCSSAWPWPWARPEAARAGSRMPWSRTRVVGGPGCRRRGLRGAAGPGGSGALGDVQSPAELVTAYLRHLGGPAARWALGRPGVVEHAYLTPPSWAVGVGLVVLLALVAPHPDQRGPRRAPGLGHAGGARPAQPSACSPCSARAPWRPRST